MTDDPRPLSGVTVVAVEQAVAAPLATRILADYGARVIKVERPGAGDFARDYDTTVRGMSSHFVWVNRSKQSIALDLRQGEALEVLERMLQDTDVFVQNLGPGAANRLGIGPAQLSERFPRLVVCSITGYGDSGPLRDRKAYDLLVQCEAGMLSITGTPETPSKVGISVADIAAGMYAAQAVLLALFKREQTGRGALLEVSLFDALADWMGFPAYYAAYSGVPPARTGAAHATIAPYGPFRSGDDSHVFLGVQNQAQWRRFCEAVLDDSGLVSDPRFATNELRVQHRGPLQELVERRFQSLTRAQVLATLDLADIPCASLNTITDFLTHPQLAARQRWRQVGSPVGDLMALIPPISINGVEPVLGPIPAVGEHTASLLREFGFPEDFCPPSAGPIEAGAAS
jgi:itaconate CoA-transferase